MRRLDLGFSSHDWDFPSSPFCCKVRAYLNYNRIPYDIVEVDSVMRAETKWSIYKKVPIVVIENEHIQLNDSSLIISVIESYLRMPTKAVKNVAKLYQPVIEKDEKGKMAFNYPNKYFLVEPLIDDLLDPEQQVYTEKSKTDANYVVPSTAPAKQASSSFLSSSHRDFFYLHLSPTLSLRCSKTLRSIGVWARPVEHWLGHCWEQFHTVGEKIQEIKWSVQTRT